MDHSFIEENNQIDRYVRGTMSVAERTAFEEHFLDCRDCLEQLEIARSLRDSIRIAAADMAASAEPARIASGRGMLRSFFGWRWLAAAATTCLAVVSLTGISLYRQLQRTRSELDRTQLAYAGEKERGRTILQSAEQNAPLVYALNQSRGASAPPKTILETYALYARGLSVEEIASQRSCTSRTIESHLADCIRAGFLVDVSKFVSDLDRAQIETAIAKHGAKKLKHSRFFARNHHLQHDSFRDRRSAALGEGCGVIS